jgi:POT family proton-dependent oligopeptide transporter
VLPAAIKVIVCASKNGFKMARTDPAYQREHRGNSVPWSSQFVEELCRGLRACRVL